MSNCLINSKTYSHEELLITARSQPNGLALWERDFWQFIEKWLDSGDFMITQSSGTTGEAKEITLHKASMRASANMTCDFFKLSQGDSILLCLPAKFISGQMVIVRALERGLNLLTVEPTASPLGAVPPTTRIDFCSMVPFQAENSTKEKSQHDILKGIKKLLLGGGPISSRQEQLFAAMPIEVYQSYGMTETCSHVAIRKVDGENKQVFHALPNVSFQQSEDGRLIINAPMLLPQPLLTNDVVALQASDCFSWVGRADNIINSGGVKHNPELLEAKISACMQHDFFIATKPDSTLGQSIILILESEPLSNIDEEALRTQLQNCLSSKEMPRKIYYLPKFSRTDNGKIRRKSTLQALW